MRPSYGEIIARRIWDFAQAHGLTPIQVGAMAGAGKTLYAQLVNPLLPSPTTRRIDRALDWMRSVDGGAAKKPRPKIRYKNVKTPKLPQS